MAGYDHIYRPSDVAKALRQGEILSDLRRHVIDPSTVDRDTPTVNRVTYPFVVVLTQDCDVFQRGEPGAPAAVSLPCILLGEVDTAKQLRGGKDINSDLWRLVRQNREERYHFLQAVVPAQDAAGEGIEELGLDFRRYLAVPTVELYALVDAGLARRRCVLQSPYMEHLCSRFGNYLNRVALPEPHFSA